MTPEGFSKINNDIQVIESAELIFYCKKFDLRTVYFQVVLTYKEVAVGYIRIRAATIAKHNVCVRRLV